MQVTVTVQPAAGGGRRDATLTRQPIRFNPVSSELCSGGGGGGGGSGSAPVGYIRVATFSKQTPDGVRDAIKSLQACPYNFASSKPLHLRHWRLT